MLGKSTQQLTFGDGFIDPELFRLDEELQQVDTLLSEKTLLKPFEESFDSTMGRSGTPVDVYLRMMYLKFRFGLAYEEVEQEVRERLPWRRFCHLSLMDSVPDSTTLIKLNQRFGDEMISNLNKQLVKHLIKTKSIKPRKIRIDSTTIESHITYPTDVKLLHSVVTTLTRTAKKLGENITSHVRATKKAVARLGQSLKTQSDNRKKVVQKTLKMVAHLTQKTIDESRQALKRVNRSAKSFANPSLQNKQATSFDDQIILAEQILTQTQEKLNGVESIADRIVSFHDPDARVIRKGKLGKPNEFGRTLELVQDQSGLMIDYTIQAGNPSDKTRAVPLVKRFKRKFGIAPDSVALDKGYYTPDNLTQLQTLGVRCIGLAKIGRLTPRERRKQKSQWFKNLQRFRCGIEASISMLKRCFCLGQILTRGSPATAIWVGFSIFSYNLWQMT
jgi:IS5 family transposase